MKVISTNTGTSRTIEWNGKQVQTGIYKFPVAEPVFLEKTDVVNDVVCDRKHHGGADKACYLYSADHYSYWKTLYPNLDMPNGMFGENLTVEGLQENEIHIGDVFQVGEAIIQVTQPRQPCYKLGVKFGDPGVVKKFIVSGFPGVYVRVIKTGCVNTGSLLTCIDNKNSVSVQKVFELLYTSTLQKDILENTLNNPYLAESCRRDLVKRWHDFL